MPQLVKLQKELKDSGFVIIGNHVQNGDKKDVLAVVRQLKVNFTVTSFSRVDVPGKGSGIPRAFLFDSKGELVEQGHPASMKQAIEALVASEPHWLAAGREYTKLGALAAALKKTKAYGTILRKLDREAKKDGVVKEEAEYLRGRIRGYGKKELGRAKALESTNPYAAYKLYSEVAKCWKGDEIGSRATKRLKEIKRDRAFKKELEAGAIAAKIREECEKLVPSRGGKIRLDYGPNRKRAPRIKAMMAFLAKKYPESKALPAVKEYASEFGL